MLPSDHAQRLLTLFHSEYCASNWLQGLTPTGNKHAVLYLLLRLDHIASRILRYVKSAVGETDVPEGLPEFINQRRRWLNGSFFAATYAIAHIGQMLSSGHSVSRKVVLSIQAFYNIINLIASWFAIVSTILEAMMTTLTDRAKGNFYLFFVILSSSLEAPSFHMYPIRYLNSVVQVLSPYMRAVIQSHADFS
jgi:cellulose synthase/poly-beta-1,6-N-acetylglucosamine synthase-like glycosyltransferase